MTEITECFRDGIPIILFICVSQWMTCKCSVLLYKELIPCNIRTCKFYYNYNTTTDDASATFYVGCLKPFIALRNLLNIIKGKKICLGLCHKWS